MYHISQGDDLLERRITHVSAALYAKLVGDDCGNGGDSPMKKAMESAKKRRMDLSQGITMKMVSQSEEVNKDYYDASFILGTNDKVEQFFSQCKSILSDTRASMTPLMFECIVFLKINKGLWTSADVVKAEAWRKETDKEERDFQKHRKQLEEAEEE